MEINKENLLKLAEGIEGIDQEFFNMRDFRSHGCHYTPLRSVSDCGTVGCAMGWAPFIEGLEIKSEDLIDNHDTKETELGFGKYGNRILGIPCGSPIWEWLFSGDWSKIDNTPTGVSLRIQEFLLNGLPDNVAEQMSDVNKYMFKDQINA